MSRSTQTDGPTFDRASRRRLTPQTARLFEGDTLFERVARCICAADCLPRKELYEAWEVAKRIRRHYRGGTVVEACAGHGLLAHLLLLLDDSSPRAICIDSRRPVSADKIGAALVATWPRLEGRVTFVEAKLKRAALPREANELWASVHACGVLTDEVLDLAIEREAHVAVMPCCHALGRCDDGDLSGWLPGPVAVDVTRAHRLAAAGYAVRTKTIPDDITPMNRLLMGAPQPRREHV